MNDCQTVNIPEAAKLLGFGINQVRAWVSSGELPSVGFKHRRILREDIPVFLRKLRDKQQEGEIGYQDFGASKSSIRDIESLIKSRRKADVR